MKARPLSSLLPGEEGVVTSIDVPAEHRPRLLEMGLLPGTRVAMIRYAPMGDPMEIRVRGYHLSLRRHEADRVMVCQP